jgi:hypothetical protein
MFNVPFMDMERKESVSCFKTSCDIYPQQCGLLQERFTNLYYPNVFQAYDRCYLPAVWVGVWLSLLYIYNGYILSICSWVEGTVKTPRVEKNPKKGNLVRSRFYGSILLIGTFTTFETVSYNCDNISFAIYLMCSSQNKNFDRRYNCNDF